MPMSMRTDVRTHAARAPSLTPSHSRLESASPHFPLPRYLWPAEIVGGMGGHLSTGTTWWRACDGGAHCKEVACASYVPGGREYARAPSIHRHGPTQLFFFFSCSLASGRRSFRLLSSFTSSFTNDGNLVHAADEKVGVMPALTPGVRAEHDECLLRRVSSVHVPGSGRYAPMCSSSSTFPFLSRLLLALFPSPNPRLTLLSSLARDAHPASPSDIFLTAGASAGVSLLINMLITAPTSGILIPIPQYPLYTAALAQHHGTPVPYYLDEEAGWATSVPSIIEAIKKARGEGVEVKALVIINPGNPTGGVLDARTMEKVVKVCEEESLVLLADEVYQDNLHDRANQPFTSFKKVVRDLQSPVPLVSFHSISKGVSGECGRRGGYFELVNVSEEVRALVYKLVSVGLCPPLSGQIGVDCMVRPPKEGEPSYALWKKETATIHEALASRTLIMAQRLSALPGVSCVQSPGALYLFPRITIPAKAIEHAKSLGKEPDAFYAMGLLEETGICVVPGSGFGQRDGEWHYRLTCLCPGVEEYVGKLEGFHQAFLKRWS
ncbi:pyridoxal phosphate-dependent transferase [Mycena alexandri]|uniref:Pyridoxal phosphate-dependent transferase n=1 Tax=Mycena alexandri TaxID=1745969 RepID=A0AAD6WW17_9AGAR|nr:pyridoxal phosphate-dependent transferase [Mycena alexandri]